MTTPPNPRTSPTVNHLGMSPRVRREWEIRLSLVQVVVLGGVVFGCMVSAFYLGLISGQRAGFESAQAIRLASAVKLPIQNDHTDATGEGLASDVYAKLKNPPPLKIDPAKILKDDSLPQLESIKTTDAAPLPPLALAGEGKISLASEKAAPQTEPEPITEKKAGQIELSRQDENSGAGIAKLLGETPEKALEITSVSSKAKKDTAVKKSISVADVITPKDSASLGSLVPQRKKLEPLPKKEEIIVAKKDEVSSAPKKQDLDTDVTLKSADAIPPKVLASKLAESEIAAEAQPSKLQVRTKGSLVREVLPKGWFAQVAAPRQISDAEAVVKKLQGSGFAVLIQEANVRGQTYFRVMVGPEDTREQSERLIGQLKRESYLRGEPFLRLIK